MRLSRFRLAACLLLELSRRRWGIETKLNEILDNLPSDLYGIYDRFLEGIDKEDFIYVEGVFRWIMFSLQSLSLVQLADAVAFDFSSPERYHIYQPALRNNNEVAILIWLEGLVSTQDCYGSQCVVLAHASVQDYLLSDKFRHKFGRDLSAGFSHTFIARTCIGHFSILPIRPSASTRSIR
jgi:hypothetical protein